MNSPWMVGTSSPKSLQVMEKTCPCGSQWRLRAVYLQKDQDTKGRIPVVGGTLMPLGWGTPGGGGGH